MALQTALAQPASQTAQETTPGEETVSPQHAQVSPVQRQQSTAVTDLLTAGEAQAARLTHAAASAQPSTIVFVTSVTLAAAACIGIGLAGSRAKPALRRLVAKTEEIRVPIALPMVLAEIAWELIADRRAVSAALAAHAGT